MDLFSKISFSHFIWYLVPGLAFVFFLLFPFLILEPHFAGLFVERLGPFGMIFLGIISGFVLDGLRLYRFRPRYNKIKKSFKSSLSAMSDGDYHPYYIQSCISDLARKKGVVGLGMHHAIWILHGHLAVLAFFEAIFWWLAAFYYQFIDIAVCPCRGGSCGYVLGMTISKDISVIVYVGLALIFSIICARFLQISTEDQETTNQMFLDFADQNSTEIKESLITR